MESEAGSKAVLRLTQIRGAETLPSAAKDLRQNAAVMWKDTRWAAVFGKAEVREAAKESEVGGEQGDGRG